MSIEMFSEVATKSYTSRFEKLSKALCPSFEEYGPLARKIESMEVDEAGSYPFAL